MSGIGHNGIAATELKNYVERIEVLEEESKGIRSDIRDIYTEAKLNGFNAKTIRSVVRLRRVDRAEREEQEALLELYLNALGMLRDTPLGEAATRNLKAGAPA